MQKVTYKGPEDSQDPTTVLEIPVPQGKGKPDEIVALPLGEEVEVADDVAKLAQKVEGHTVDAKSAGSGGSSS